MATPKIEMLYNLRQSNAEDTQTYGLWYPQPVRRSTLSLRGLCDHIAEHGSIYTRDVVSGVLTKFISCVVELVSQGVGVKIDGLGTFYPTFEAKGSNTPVEYDLSAKLQGVHLRFLPDDADLDKLTSRAFKGKCVFKLNMIFDKHGKPKRIENGQLVDYGDDDDGQQP